MRSQLFINGQWVDGHQRAIVRQPFDLEAIEQVHLASEQQLDLAVRDAHRAFEAHRSDSPHLRRKWLSDAATQIEGMREEFATAICREAGKPISLARGEVDRAISTLRTASEEAVRFHGELLNLAFDPSSVGTTGLVRRFPIGVVVGITPFNFPLNLVTHKVAPAIACGCSIVLRPSRSTPLTALLLAQAFSNASLPEGLLQVVACTTDAAKVLVRHPLVRKISFTGSAPVGWKLRETAFDKHVTLELGGNAAVVVDESADLDRAAQRCAMGAFAYAGQVCISVQRIYCHTSVFAAFRDRLVQHTRALGVGNPMDDSVMVGPMVSDEEADRVCTWVEEARSKGGELVLPIVRDRNVIHPVIVQGADPACRVVSGEVFGPVCTLDRFDAFDEALRMVNDSRYGLQAGVFTSNLHHAWRAFHNLEVGAVIVNDFPTFRTDPMPYGGVKESGTGREGVRYAMEAMSEMRMLVLRDQ